MMWLVRIWEDIGFQTYILLHSTDECIHYKGVSIYNNSSDLGDTYGSWSGRDTSQSIRDRCMN